MKFIKYLPLLLISFPTEASAYDEAFKTAALAAVKQAKVDEMIRNKADLYIQKDLMLVLDNVTPIINAAITQRLDIRWTF